MAERKLIFPGFIFCRVCLGFSDYLCVFHHHRSKSAICLVELHGSVAALSDYKVGESHIGSSLSQ